MTAPCNWRNTLLQYASISGVLAGFCVTFIGIVLGWSVAETAFYDAITYGNICVLFFGVSAGLFISSAEFFLLAKSLDVFDLAKKYEEWLQRDCEDKGEDWHNVRNISHENCRRNEKYGRFCYNASIFIMFFGLGFAIAPYNPSIAIIVTALGVLLQSLQAKLQK